ncbi:hypothetical protein [Bacillus sp. 7884-1]|uniref:hypothetical protein n=1 Tax=Bacillus sp. 7884-1 TaxID=2021693 RepID=UPI000BA7E07F|nr:hypothetical protein [Bacillus sp. 7884-1]PAE36660.1 hypothetical protein CHI06_22030 [Bacillus sp. 7884-1]
MKKKIALIASFTLGSLLMLGQFVYAEKNDDMMSDKGMMKMMEVMQSPEGQKMMKACGQMME